MSPWEGVESSLRVQEGWWILGLVHSPQVQARRSPSMHTHFLWKRLRESHPVLRAAPHTTETPGLPQVTYSPGSLTMLSRYPGRWIPRALGTPTQGARYPGVGNSHPVGGSIYGPSATTCDFGLRPQRRLSTGSAAAHAQKCTVSQSVSRLPSK